MSLNRRTFLRHTSLGAIGLTAGAKAVAADAVPALKLPAFDARAPEDFWSAVRAQFPLTPRLTYFNTGGLGPACRPALDRAAELTRQLQEKSEHGHGLIAGARAIAARFLGADPAEIAFVRNATEGNAIVAAGLALRAGDEVIYESHAHPGGAFAWLQQARLRGIVVKTFEPATTTPEENVARVEKLLTPRTRVVQVSHVTAPTGIVMPVDALARLCHARGVWFHIDGAQSAGMIPFSLREIGGDSFATSGHKWIGGPHETGVLWVRRDRMDEVAPVLAGAYTGDIDAATGEFKLTENAMRYEYGTRNAAAMHGLAEAMRFQEGIGRDRIAARGRALAERVRRGLAALKGVEILTPAAPALCAAMITFRTATVPHDKLFSRLMSARAIRCRPVTEEKLNALRVSTHIFNSPAECDALIVGVEEILRTP
ncbi:MAG: aminotransferase class V-fold PLP-dependent enzyme [Opitutaceae bacterium]|nr:aminotransferase class V-fold PLP-dependent enzyme [Opitutaceae bacterium]